MEHRDVLGAMCSKPSNLVHYEGLNCVVLQETLSEDFYYTVAIIDAGNR